MFKSQRYHAKATFPEQAGGTGNQAEKWEVGKWESTADIDQSIASKGAAIARWENEGGAVLK